MIGKTIHHYRILEELGSGGMGTVYKAQDTKLDRLVALKFLAPYLSRDENEKNRFIHEAKAISALDHPNICSIYEINETDEGQMYIAMACYKGKSLQDLIKEGRLPVERVIEIAVQIVEGLAAAHSKDIIHRDIKPANILITEEGNVKIVDFGLAKLAGRTVLTKDGSTMGTTAFMSPEQVKGAKVDNRTDIWAFGIILYDMLTGELPFKGEYDQAIIYSIINEDPQLVNDIEPSLKNVIIKSLKKNPEERYQNVGEIAEELSETNISKEVKSNHPKQSKFLWIVSGAAVIVIAIALYLFMPLSKSDKGAETIKTIAVLPFTDMSPNKDQEYFSDGISDELINRLSRNPKLRVTARTSSFYFKGTKTNIKTIAQTLNVKHILEGSVRKSGNNLRISADLVNAETEATLWSKTYDGTMNNIFALQDSISGNVAEALNAALLGKGAAKPGQKTDPEAYNFYLLGRHFLELQGKENLDKAEDYFEKSLSIDSTYAPAWVGLSGVHFFQTINRYIPLEAGYLKAENEVKKALHINPNFAEAYMLKGTINFMYKWNWAEAEESIKKGLELEPNNRSVLNGAAYFASCLGKFNEAITLEYRAIKIDPVRSINYFFLGLFSARARLFNQSIAAFKKCIELNPEYPGVHSLIGFNYYFGRNRVDTALLEIQKEREKIWQRWGYSIIYYAIGRKKEADENLQQLIKEFQDGWAFQIAEIYAYRVEKDNAFYWLERAYTQHDPGLVYIKDEPLLRNIVKDPRYAAFMKKMNLPTKR